MKTFCDFDGTAAANDVGNLLFRTFADEKKCHEIVSRWKNGLISSKECYLEECKLARVTERELRHFSDTQELDPSFRKFATFCCEHDIEIEIVSDGFDFYVERILKNHGLDSLDARCNRLVFENGGGIKPEFPFHEHSCGRCANCKGYHVRLAREHHDTVIYIGDGLSDRCGAEAADVVFAKKDRDLLKYCRQKDIPCIEYRDFGDMLTWFTNKCRYLELTKVIAI
ncbi:MAG: MtnX-like HAD-IB family phosphatase [bacterium]